VSRYESQWLMVCNAGNRMKVLAHLHEHAEGRNVTIDDQTEQTVMLAVQGPAAMDLFRRHVPIPIGELKRYGFASGTYMGMNYTVFRSGYTGEDGVEVILPATAGMFAWEYITRENEDGESTVRPAGLAARDTLRLEAGMPLYGHELSEDVDPISAGCGWCVDLDKSFLGAEALRRIQSAGPQRRMTGLALEGRRIARQDSMIANAGQPVGVVTSGTLSPTLDRSIAMGYVDAEILDNAAPLTVDVRGTMIPATPVPLPFYKRSA